MLAICRIHSSVEIKGSNKLSRDGMSAGERDELEATKTCSIQSALFTCVDRNLAIRTGKRIYVIVFKLLVLGELDKVVRVADRA